MRVNSGTLSAIMIAILLVGCGGDDNKKKSTSSSSSLSSAVASSEAPASSSTPSSIAVSSEAPASSSVPSSVAVSSISPSSTAVSSSAANSSITEVPVSSSAASLSDESSSSVVSSSTPASSSSAPASSSSAPESSSAASSSAPADVVLDGVAAVGAAIVNGTVTAKCANGSGFTQTVTTNSQGVFSGTLPITSFPCALQITGGTPAVTLHSYALTSGTVNITPLTDLLIASATTQTPSAWFQSSSWQILEAQLQTAQNNLKTVLTNASYVLPQGNFDPLTISFQIGDVWDQLLDQLQAAIAASNTLSSYTDLLNLVKDGNLNAIPPKSSGNPGGSGTGNAASCFNADLAKQGTKIQLNYKSTDGDSGAVLNTDAAIEVKGSVTFNGASTIESVSQTQATGASPSTSTTKSYLTVDASAKRFSYYGSIVDATAPYAISSTITINPARLERFDLTAGESYTLNYNINTATQVLGFPVNTVTEYSSTITFKGIETISVPAGSFSACRMETSNETTSQGTTINSLSVNWISVDTGISVRTEADGDITELVSATINGNAIQ